MSHGKNIFVDFGLYAFALRVHNEETPMLKISEKNVLGHILPKTPIVCLRASY